MNKKYKFFTGYDEQYEKDLRKLLRTIRFAIILKKNLTLTPSKLKYIEFAMRSTACLLKEGEIKIPIYRDFEVIEGGKKGEGEKGGQIK